jgi:hypothetical protein
MPYDRPHYYLTFGGTLFPLASGHEQWQTGIHFAPDATRTEGQLLDALEQISVVDILADCTKLIKGQYGFNCNWSNVVTIDWAKLVVKKTDGHYAGAPKLVEQTGQTGSAGAYPYAPQLAVVASFWTGANFGRALRGRMYLPPPYALISSLSVNDPRATAATANDLRDAVKQWLNAVGGEVNTLAVPTSPAILSSLGTGTTNFISKIGVGRVIDTMRSRRSALDEAITWTDR